MLAERCGAMAPAVGSKEEDEPPPVVVSEISLSGDEGVLEAKMLDFPKGVG